MSSGQAPTPPPAGLPEPLPVRPLMWLLLAGIVLRAITLREYAELPFFTSHRLDAVVYDQAARAWLNGAMPPEGQPFHLSPLYSLFVALVYGLGADGDLGFRVAHALLGLATIACVYFAGARAAAHLTSGSSEQPPHQARERVALICGGLALAYGPALHYERFLCVAPLGAALHAGLFLQLLRCGDQGSPLRRWAFAGLLFGLCVAARPNALFLAPAFLLPWLNRARADTRGWSPRLRQAGLAALCAAMVIAPIAAANHRSTNEFIPVSSTGGLNFYIGNGAGANGLFRAPQDLPDALNLEAQLRAYRASAESTAGRTLSWREVDAHWWKRSAQDIAAAPGAWATLMLKKLDLFWNGYEPPNTHHFEFQKRVTSSLYLAPLSFWGLGALFIASLIAAGTQRLRPAADGHRSSRARNLSLAYAGLYTFSIALFFVVGRYRHPLFPVLCVAVGPWLFSLWRERHERLPMLYALLLLGGVLLFMNRELERSGESAEFHKLGYSYQVLGQAHLAEAAYLDALALDANNLKALNNLGVLLAARGATNESAQVWLRVRELGIAHGSEAHVRRADNYLDRLRGVPAAD